MTESHRHAAFYVSACAAVRPTHSAVTVLVILSCSAVSWLLWQLAHCTSPTNNFEYDSLSVTQF